MLRSIYVLVLFAIVLIAAVGAPFTGILGWTWLSLMTPHKLAAGGFIDDMPFNLILTIVTVLSWLASNEPKRIPPGTVTRLWFAFMVMITLTTIFSLNTDLAWDRLSKTLKVMALGLMVAILATNRQRIHFLVWVIVLSIGYFGVKGGLFTLMTGGGHGSVVGPAESSIGDDNYLALALGMTLPLMYYLIQRSSNRLTRVGMIVAMILTIIGVLGTYSRGGFIGLGVMGLFLWWRSRQRVVLAVVAVVVMIPIIQFMPQKWVERVNSIQTGTQVRSLQTRLDAWHVAFNIAKAHPILGGGFGATENADIYRTYSYGQSMFRGDRQVAEIRFAHSKYHLNMAQLDQIFPPDFTGAHAVHSIYFQVLSDHGFVGLFLFLALMITTWFQMGRLRRATRRDPEWAWASDLASMMQVSMVTFFAAGAGVSMCYYDLPYLLIGITLALGHMLKVAKPATEQNLNPAAGRTPADTRLRPAMGGASARQTWPN